MVFGHHHGWGRYKDSSNDSDDDFTDTFACARELTTVQRHDYHKDIHIAELVL